MGGGALLAVVPALAAGAPTGGAWRDSADARAVTGAAAPVTEGITLHLPNVSDSGAFLPLRLSVEHSRDDFPDTVHVIAPENPFPRVAVFRFTPLAGRARIATRIRLDVSQTVIAVARMRSGTVRVAERAIRIASSGCITPADGDWSEAMRTRVRAPVFEAGVPGEVVTLIKHPMENGLGPDAPPKRIIERFEARLDGEPALAATLGRSVAADPYLRFHLAPRAPGTLRLEWRENTGRRAVERLRVEVR
ncbi:thiosulfate oxidation carrier protein SoxY [Nitratireductor sp. GCM10026969]|uniref:thiosulfate oxidation carrier protein SoxY n=1 Tax=Nitratireductor sp. GCM10026969 TaxID=3252645 RepID=UPI003615C8A3